MLGVNNAYVADVTFGLVDKVTIWIGRTPGCPLRWAAAKIDLGERDCLWK